MRFPAKFHDKDDTARQLARIVHQDPEDRYTTAHDIDARLHRSRDFAWVARKVDANVAVRVRALGLKGVYFQKEFKRFYPDNQLAAQVLGYVSMDDNGLGGIEHRFDEHLHGASGPRADGRRCAAAKLQQSWSANRSPGENLVLTLDDHIQFMAEKALDEAMLRTKAATRHYRCAGPEYRPDSSPGDPPDVRSQRHSPHSLFHVARPRGQRCL